MVVYVWNFSPPFHPRLQGDSAPKILYETLPIVLHYLVSRNGGHLAQQPSSIETFRPPVYCRPIKAFIASSGETR